MNNLADAAFVDGLYDKLGVGGYSYSHALTEIATHFPIVRGSNKGKGFEALEDPVIFRKKQALAGKLNTLVAMRLKEAVPSLEEGASRAFLKSKGIAAQYQDTILEIARRSGGRRRRSTRRRSTRRRR